MLKILKLTDVLLRRFPIDLSVARISFNVLLFRSSLMESFKSWRGSAISCENKNLENGLMWFR